MRFIKKRTNIEVVFSKLSRFEIIFKSTYQYLNRFHAPTARLHVFCVLKNLDYVGLYLAHVHLEGARGNRNFVLYILKMHPNEKFIFFSVTYLSDLDIQELLSPHPRRNAYPHCRRCRCRCVSSASASAWWSQPR
jgi:hypothetical protein